MLCQGIEVLYILTVRISIRTLVPVLSNFKRTLVPCKNLSPSSGENFQKIEVKFCGRRFLDFQPVFALGGVSKSFTLILKFEKNFRKKVGNLKIIFLCFLIPISDRGGGIIFKHLGYFYTNKTPLKLKFKEVSKHIVIKLFYL